MGEAIQQMFESQMQWSYQYGDILITGRDVVCIIAGLFMGIAFVMFLIVVSEMEKEIKNV